MLANPVKGEIRFTAGSADYVFVLDFRAQKALETKYDKRFLEIVTDDLDEMRSDGLADLIWTGLQRHHPQVSLAAVEEMFDELGVGFVITEIITPGVRLVLNVPVDPAAAEPGKARPRKARGGI